MKYFNGFSLLGEEKLFEAYVNKSAYTVAGFSYGAQKALEYAYQSTERIDKLILLSPAFFQNQKKSFIRSQLRYFDAGQESYIKQFLTNVSYPHTNILENYLNIGTREQLSSLLTYTWDKQKIQALIERGVTIEVFIGTEDKIVDTKEVLAFFEGSSCVRYLIKGSGHLLGEVL